jgi:rhodanese-related sulfurtransferase
LPKYRDIVISCRSARRAYAATRMRLKNGCKARNLSRGTLARVMQAARREELAIAG